MKGRSALAGALDRAGYCALLLLALLAAFESPNLVIRASARLSMTNIEILLVMAVGIWLCSAAAGGRMPRAPSALVAPVAVWIAALLVAMFIAPSNRLDSLRFISRVVSGLAIAWVAYNLTTLPRQTTVLKAAVVGGLAVAVLGLAEMAGFSPIASWLVRWRGAPTRVGDLLRLTSTLIYTTITAMYLELIIPVAVAWIVTARGAILRLLLAGGLVALMSALVLTLTRSGIVAVCVALCVAAVVVWRRQRALARANLFAVFGALVFAVALIAANPLVGLRLRSEGDSLWYRAGYQLPATATLRPKETASIPFIVTNTSVRVWQAGGAQYFALSYRIVRANGTSVATRALRTRLPRDIAPGETISLSAQITAPPDTGIYTVEWDMLQETITWFTLKGAQPAIMRLTVAGQVADGPAADSTAPTLAVSGVSMQPTGRLDLWRIAWQMLRERPILGVGPDNFRFFYGAYLGRQRWDTTIHANNTYIEFFVGSGVVGGAAFLWFAGTLWALLLKGLRRGDRLSPPGGDAFVWFIALSTSMLAWFLHGLFDHFYAFTPAYVVFWLMAGLAVRMAENASRTAA